MYYRHFALDGPPFRFTSSPTSMYLGTAHRECLAALEWGVLHDQCGFMLLLGETGTGKTTLVNTILTRRLRNLHLACVPNPRLSFQEILRVVLPQLGVVTDERGKLELIQALERAVANRPEGTRTAIIIDEAQDLTDEILEDLRLLANTVGARDRELQIVLMGHPELLDRLSAHHMRQLRERIATKVSLPALSTTESVAYIDYRLQAQNGSARIFEPNALRYIIDAAAGIPRRLNVLCHNALLLAYSKKKNTVTLEVAREVVADYESIFPPSNAPLSNDGARRELETVESSIIEYATNPEPVIRLRRPMALAAAACAAFAILGLGSVFVARTSNLSGEFDRMAHRIEAAPVTPQVSSQSTEDVKTVAATLGYTASIADASPAPIPPALKTQIAPAPRRATVQIRPGDTFHDLAVKYLGSKDRARELIKANPQIKDPDNLYVGQTIYLPAHQPTDLAGEVQ
jgi:type II secretory pathway predicted ATPase ExeA